MLIFSFILAYHSVDIQGLFILAYHSVDLQGLSDWLVFININRRINHIFLISHMLLCKKRNPKCLHCPQSVLLFILNALIGQNYKLQWCASGKHRVKYAYTISHPHHCSHYHVHIGLICHFSFHFSFIILTQNFSIFKWLAKIWS